MNDLCLIEPCFFQRLVQRVLNVRRGYASSEFPGDNVATVVIQDCTKKEPTPADNFEISEVGLPKLVGCCRLVEELISGLHHDEGRAGDKIMGSQKPVNTGFRDKVVVFVGERHRQFSWAQLRPCQCHFQHCLAHRVRDAVPDAPRMRLTIRKTGLAALKIPIIPTIEGWARHAQLLQCAFDMSIGIQS